MRKVNTEISELCVTCGNNIPANQVFCVEDDQTVLFYCFKCANKHYERTTSPLTFWVFQYGLETTIQHIYSDFEYQNTPSEEFPTSHSVYSITVKNLEDKKKWILLKNQWLHCAWTPNQTSEEQLENHYEIENLEKQMRELEIR